MRVGITGPPKSGKTILVEYLNKMITHKASAGVSIAECDEFTEWYNVKVYIDCDPDIIMARFFRSNEDINKAIESYAMARPSIEKIRKSRGKSDIILCNLTTDPSQHVGVAMLVVYLNSHTIIIGHTK